MFDKVCCGGGDADSMADVGFCELSFISIILLIYYQDHHHSPLNPAPPPPNSLPPPPFPPPLSESVS